MKKLTFIELNDALVMLQSAEHYEADCALLARVNPQSALQNEIANASDFNRTSIQGRVLVELLGLVSIEEIKENRKPKAQEDLEEEKAFEDSEDLEEEKSEAKASEDLEEEKPEVMPKIKPSKKRVKLPAAEVNEKKKNPKK